MKILTTAALALTLVSTAAYADGVRDFTLYNHSSKTIEAVYFSVPGYNTWKHVNLDSPISPNGDARITFNEHNSSVCELQMRIDLRGNSYAEFYDTLNLCTARSVTVTYDAESKSYLATAEPYILH